MKFSWKWLNEIIDLQNIPLNQIINRLTLSGFEIENIENRKDDKTLNINITTNRSDATSIIGIARELSYLFNIQLYNRKQKTENNFDKREITQEIQLIPNRLLDFQFNIIDQIDIQTSPKWLQEYLVGCNILPQNTLVDIKQYINIKWGQEIEIFDVNKIDNTNFDRNLIKITSIYNSHKYINTSKLKTHNKETLLEGLTYKDKMLSIFGVESNPNIFCDKDTSSIIILGYICKTDYIKTIIHQLNDKTDKSQKHIKGLSRYDFLEAYQEITNLIFNLSHKKNSRSTPYYKWHEFPIQLNHIEVHRKKIHNILGPSNISLRYLTVENIIEILQQLKFQPKYQDNIFFVTIPEHRSTDIKRPIDVIEEIGRIHGFNNFLDKLPLSNKKVHTSNLTKVTKKIRTTLRNFGLHEVIHHSLDNTYDKNLSIKLYNPLLKDQKNLRNTLIYNLLNTVTYNYKHKNSALECFEVGRVFQKQTSYNTTRRYNEHLHLAGVIGNPYSKTLWSDKEKELSWFQAKGLVESLLEQLHASIVWNTIKNFSSLKSDYSVLKIYHPYRYAILQDKETKEVLGIFSEINLKHFKDLNTKYHHYVFELDLTKFLRSIPFNQHLNYIWKKYSLYPSIVRDISLTLMQNTKVCSIQTIILSNNNALIESVEILSEYYVNNNVYQDRNVNFRITYRSKIKTLNDHDTQNIDKDINSLLKMIHQIIYSTYLE